MKAMIFAAGLGTRLRPLTDSMPKALVPVAGKPMLEHVVTRLVNAGFDDIVVNIHHFGEQIIDFLQSHDFNAKITISDERDLLLDTGGGVKKACEFLGYDEPVLLHNADIFTNVDLRALYASHIASGSDATLLVAERQSSRQLYFNGQKRLCGWMNKNTGETKPGGFAPSAEMRELAFSGVHVVSPAMLRAISEYSPDSPVFSIMPFYLSVCNSLRIDGYESPTQYHWFDIGKVENLRKVEELAADFAI